MNGMIIVTGWLKRKNNSNMHCSYKKIIFLIVGLNLLNYSCNCNNESRTPAKYINYSRIVNSKYSKDSLLVEGKLKFFLNKKSDFFNNSAYFEHTQIQIDTIIYSPDFNKMAIFVIVQNPVYRQLVPDKNFSFYYDATCYIGIREKDSINLKWLGPGFTNSIDKKKLSQTIRYYYFKEFAVDDTSNGNIYRYNLNDKRFWETSVWQRIEKN